MRRDLHKWFLAGIAFSTFTAIFSYAFLQNAQVAIGLVVVCNALMLVLLADAWRRRRQFRRWYTHDDNFRSRELRCPPPRNLHTHFVAVR